MYDDIVIGGGSSGAVMASRLSENPNRKVLLLEAGPCFKGISATPPELLNHDIPVLRGYNWNVNGYISDEPLRQVMSNAARSLNTAGSRFSMAKTAFKSAVSGNNIVGRYDCPVGRVLGGSSSVNGALALRALPVDFVTWVDKGCSEWSWEKVLPFFKKIEADFHHQNEFHGSVGCVPIHHEKPKDFTRAQKAFYDVCLAKGFPHVEDFNAPESNGVGGFPKNINERKQRVSSSLAYLTEEVLARDNLSIVEKARVNQLCWQGQNVRSVETIVSGRLTRFEASRVVLCAGYIHSPAILVRSGVGPEADLKRLDIPVHLPLAGVGQNLIDHPVATIWARPKEGVCPIGETTHQVSLRYSSLRNSGDSDMSLFMLSAFNISSLSELKDLLNSKQEAMAISAVLGAPSSTGCLNFTSKDPAKSPTVCANLLREPNDMARMVEGVQLSWSIIQSEQMIGLVDFIPVWHEQIMRNTKKIEQILKSFVRGSNHAGGTAKMGAEDHPASVVNQQGKVLGTDNLYIADTSVMPETVRSSTNLTAMMISEKIAAGLQ